MPSFDTLCGKIRTRPSKNGTRAFFEPYPMTNEWLDEEGATEEEALGNIVEQLNNVAIEARNSIAEYLKKQKAKIEKLEAPRAKNTKPKRIWERENLTARRVK